jgi:hypothetical protein
MRPTQSNRQTWPAFLQLKFPSLCCYAKRERDRRMERFTLLVASDRYAGLGNYVRVRICNTRNTLNQQ